MKPLLVILGVILLAVVADAESKRVAARPLPPCIPGEIPHANFLDLPPEWRQKNYGPSCAWATTISMLRAQGMFEEAALVRKHGYGGAGYPHVNALLNKLGIGYLYTADGDETLLEYALMTNRGAGVHWYTGHATMLVGRRDGYAIILDNNRTQRYVRIPWQRFLREWKANGGWAWVITDPRGKPLPESILQL